jgi:hypothetical protein
MEYNALFDQSNTGLKRKNVRELYHMDSKTEDLLQLADIILGCHFSHFTTATSNPKLSIRSVVFGRKEHKFKCLPYYSRNAYMQNKRRRLESYMQ